MTTKATMTGELTETQREVLSHLNGWTESAHIPDGSQTWRGVMADLDAMVEMGIVVKSMLHGRASYQRAGSSDLYHLDGETYEWVRTVPAGYSFDTERRHQGQMFVIEHGSRSGGRNYGRFIRTTDRADGSVNLWRRI